MAVFPAAGGRTARVSVVEGREDRVPLSVAELRALAEHPGGRGSDRVGELGGHGSTGALDGGR